MSVSNGSSTAERRDSVCDYNPWVEVRILLIAFVQFKFSLILLAKFKKTLI